MRAGKSPARLGYAKIQLMKVPVAEIVPLLEREYLFQTMSDEQLLWIAGRFQPVEYDKNQLVYRQGTRANAFYMVYKGSIRVVRSQGGQERDFKVLVPGDFFGEEALLYDRPHLSSLAAEEESVVLRMPEQAFFSMLEAYPEVRERLTATAESRRLARTLTFEWLGEDEVVYFITRKHQFFLFTALILPIVLFVLSFPLLAFALIEVNTPFWFGASLFLGLLMLLGSLAWGVWNYLDWANDYYIVTSQRVIWFEKVIGLYESRREAPLGTILAVNVNSSQLGRILGYGDVSVRTFTGGIYMKNAGQPGRFASFVEGFKRRAIERSREQEARAMEEALDEALTRSVAMESPDVPEVPPQAPPKKVKKKEPQKKKARTPSTIHRGLDYMFKVRYEEGGVITYRKHWFQLLKKTALPLTALLLVIGAEVGAAWLQAAGTVFLGSGFVLLTCGSVILIGAFLWLLYEFLDWSNDIYRLTRDQILDIERKPLGSENKKSAPLESILSIEHERENILGVILNFGPVIINVGETRFVFRNVYNPDQVHQDVSDYREALIRRKREKEKNEERDRMVDWLVAYHNSSETLEDYKNEPGYPEEPLDSYNTG